MGNFSDNLKFSHLVFEIFLYMFQYRVYNRDNEELASSIYEKIKNFGGLIVKITQWMMSRVEFMYDGLYNNLSLSKKLTTFYEHCPPHSFNYTKKIIKDEFGKDFDKIFESLDKKPIASGSIGQVYKGKYKGKTVAVKIKHPNINEKLEIYSNIVINVYSKVTKIPYINRYLLPVSLDGLLDYLNKQIDFNCEAVNFEKFRKNFGHFDNIVIPKIYHSSNDLIIMEYVEGKSIDKIKDNETSKKAISTLYLFARESFILHGYLHADLHKGNWKIILPKKKSNPIKIVIFDAGLILEEDKEKTKFSDLWYIFERKEYENMVNLICNNIENNNKKYEVSMEDIKKELYEKLLPNIDKDLWNDILTIMKYITEKKYIVNFNVFNYLISLNILISNFQNIKLFGECNTENTFYAKYFTDRLLYFSTFCENKKYYTNIKKELDESYVELLDKFNDKFKEHYKNKDSDLEKIENIIDLDTDTDEIEEDA